jgi:hypothetical protein
MCVEIYVCSCGKELLKSVGFNNYLFHQLFAGWIAIMLADASPKYEDCRLPKHTSSFKMRASVWMSESSPIMSPWRSTFEAPSEGRGSR